jgi:GNAT superfamily N-acetyltransferase
MDVASISVLPFQAEDQLEVKRLILAGLQEHWGQLDPTKNPDLNVIRTHYAKAVFLVARHGNRIVGCGALVPRPHAAGEIVRMSVASDHRREGIGQTILQALMNQARALGYERVFLETTSTWQEVITFYLHCGFTITHQVDGDTYFEMLLPPQ